MVIFREGISLVSVNFCRKLLYISVDSLRMNKVNKTPAPKNKSRVGIFIVTVSLETLTKVAALIAFIKLFWDLFCIFFENVFEIGFQKRV